MRTFSSILDGTPVTVLALAGSCRTPEEDTGHDCLAVTHRDGSACVPDEADADTDADADAERRSRPAPFEPTARVAAGRRTSGPVSVGEDAGG